jgi:phosphoglycerate dehydrogenase-like enzyme
MNVLILGKEQNAHEYKSHLIDEFPEVQFFSAREESEVGDFIEKADVLVCLRISDALLSRARNLQWIQSMIAGTDSIEKHPSFQARKEILLTSSRGIHGPQMSELAIMLMIAMNRQFPRMVRNQDRRVWERWPTRLLYNKKVGILGIGAIGESLARKCKAFEMTVWGVGRVKRTVEAVDEFHTLDALPYVASGVDYFVCLAPSRPDTKKIVSADVFSRMKPSAFFLNLSRGDVVDEVALLDVLQRRKIAGAALDVFWQEPLPTDSPFWGLDNVIVTPRVGGMSDIYIQQAVKIFRENLRRYLKGEKRDLLNVVTR